MSKKLQQSKCPECSNLQLIKDAEMGEIVCSQCGLVIRDETLDRGPEWRAFTLEENNSKRRVGAPTSFSKYDKGLSTVIKIGRDAHGRPLPPGVRSKMWRLRKWNIRARLHPSKNRNLAEAMGELYRLSDKMHIPRTIQEMAARIYRKALNEDLVRGRSIASIAAASLYAACRLTGTPRTLKEVAKNSFRDKEEIARCYRLLLQELEMKMPIDDPIKHVSKIASRVGVDSKTEVRAIKILKEARKKKVLLGKNPKGMAAAALYLAACLEKEKVTQKELAKASGVTEVTVRNRYKGLEKALSLEV